MMQAELKYLQLTPMYLRDIAVELAKLNETLMELKEKKA